MKAGDKQVLDEFSKGIRTRQPDAEIWAFGSRVKETADEDSDLDVCVVLPHLDEETDRFVIATAWDVGFRRGRLISTVTYSSSEFHHGPCKASALVQSILEEGLAA